MRLLEYLGIERGRQTRLAKEIGAYDVDVHYWKTGRAPVPIKSCVAIEKATSGAVTRKDLRPHDWWQIWPELAENDCDS